ncbi:MAG: class I SAM-dependent methyltransferase [Eubacteriales bacterium]|jgi:predicted methyltransferase
MSLNTVGLTHDFMARHVQPGDLCIDATAGRGRDTVFLCGLVGEEGHVLAFDIQQQAVDATRLLLRQQGVANRAQVLLDSHIHMNRYACPGTVSCIAFNFGYLPGGDHNIFTRPDSSIAAIEQGLELLRPGGVMSLAIYSGGDTGYEERDALLAYLKMLDQKKYTVLVTHFFNRPNDPPIPVFILKEP